MNHRPFWSAVLFVCCGNAMADPLDSPGSYYDSATGLGAALKAQLNAIIDQHTSLGYPNRHTGILFLDQDPNNSLNIIEVYSGFSVAKTQFPNGTANTEHLWPNSYGIDDGEPTYSDFFNLRPCDASVNSSRGNKYYDNVGGTIPAHAEAPECHADGTRWEPRPIEKGDLARAMFYMDVRYEGDATDGFPRNLQLTDDIFTITISNNNMGKLSTLVQWHFEDPISSEERLRNQRIFSGCGYVTPASCQQNRNPFVDRPEFVWAIWGGSPNDSTVYFGDVIPADGAAPLSIELPTVIVGATAWADTPLVLRKAGTTPTTYEINLAGEATCDFAGPRRAFVTGAQSRSVSVGLAVPGGAGPHSGIVTINNTDLTSAAAGQGSADGNDVITLTGTLLDHAAPSFDNAVDQLTLNLDFGVIQQDSGMQTLPFAIHNREVSPGFTARLELVSIQSSGDISVLTTDAGPFSNLPAHQSVSFLASLDTANEGTFAATYTFSTHDESLPGGVDLADLVLTLSAEVTLKVPCIAADANCDQATDELDIASFTDLLLGVAAPCALCTADMNTDRNIDGGDVALFVNAVLNP